MAWKPAHGLFLSLLVVTVVVWIAAELRQAVKRRPEADRIDWGSETAVRAAIIAGALAAALVARSVPEAGISPTVLAAWSGLALLWCGVALRIWCFQTLGRYFTLTIRTSTDQPVIADGPYRVLRHPSYTALLLCVVGIGLFIGNWMSVLVLTAGVTAGLVLRIHIEERALLEGLGDRYRNYAADRKRLVPFLW